MNKKQEALATVVNAAGIHAERMEATLTEPGMVRGFADSRRRYVAKVREAIGEVAGTQFEDSIKVAERVRDLDLAESVALLHAVEDHIRSISGRSPLA